MQNVLCVGEALIDMICTDKGTSLAEGLHFMKKTGGAPTNVAAAIAALGGKVDIMACVGADPFGQQLIDEMRAFGVGTSWIRQTPDYFTTLAFVSLMEDGERDFVFNRGADGQLSLSDLPQFSADAYGIIHFGSATAFLDGPLQTTYQTLLETAGESGTFVCFDPNYRHLLFKNKTNNFIARSWIFMQKADFFKVSDEEAQLITATESLSEAIRILTEKTRACFAVTLGSEGTLFRLGNDVWQIPSIPVAKVEDTTGAGDAFVGAVLCQLSQHSPEEMKQLDRTAWESIIYNANKAGAKTCEYIGAMEAFKQLSTEIFKK